MNDEIIVRGDPLALDKIFKMVAWVVMTTMIVVMMIMMVGLRW